MADNSIVIRFMQQGVEIPIDALGKDGVTIGGERDASPRRVLLTLDAADPITAMQMQQIRHREGWAPGQFRLKAQRAGGRLTFVPMRSGALPNGRYRIRLRVDDLGLPSTLATVALNGTAPTVLDLEAHPVNPAITMKDAADVSLRRVIRAPASRIDGMPVAEWLGSPAPRTSRKACLLNLLATIRSLGGPRGSLLDEVDSVFFADCDRIYAQVSAAFLARLRQGPGAGAGADFIVEGKPRSPVHKKLLKCMAEKTLGNGGAYELISFRHSGSPGMQAVVATPKSGRGPLFADLDIDLGNPLEDVRGFAIHMGEMIDPAVTDHLALHDVLRQPPTGEFLLYDLADRT